jgi:signal transduction histidine kinase
MMTTAPMEKPAPLPSPAVARTGWLARVAAVAATIVCVAGAVGQRSDATLPPDVLDLVIVGGVPTPGLAVDGVPVADKSHLDVLLRWRGPGHAVTIQPVPGMVTTVRDVSDPVVALTLVSALASLAVAAAVLAPRRARAGIADLHAAFLATAVLIAVGGVTRPSSPMGYVLAYANIVAFGVLPATFARFSLSFPGTPSRFARPLGTVILVGTLGLVGWSCVAWAPCLATPTHANYLAARTPWKALQMVFVAGLVAGLALIARRSVRPATSIERRQARWILAGVAIGAAPYTLLRVVPRLFGYPDAPLSTAVDRTIEIAVPLAFAAAVARDRLLGIDLIRRRRLVHASVALAIAAALFGALMSLADAVLPAGAESARWTLALSLALPAALFGTIRRTIAPLIDQHVFGIDARRDEALMGLREQIAQADTPEQLAATVAGIVETALHATSVRVLVAADGESAPRESNAQAAPDGGQDLAATGTHRFSRALTSSEPGIEGAITVGPKRDGRAYVDDEIAFVDRVAEVTAAALERVRLRLRFAREEAARLAAADLARRKTDFFARLAHDLRSPLASIRWSAANVRDGLAGPVAPGQAEYLGSIEAAAVQLSRLVDDLVDLGRSDLDVGTGQRVRLGDVVREGAQILRPVAAARGVEIAASIAEDVPAVRGRHDAALRIVVNLLDNAVKYSPPGARVEASVARTPEGGVVVSVRDHGPGLPPGDRERLFLLFEQGPESPHSGTKGFGIGLHVVKSWTEAMAGSVSVDDAPGGGARFTCRFPPAPQEETPS